MYRPDCLTQHEAWRLPNKDVLRRSLTLPSADDVVTGDANLACLLLDLHLVAAIHLSTDNDDLDCGDRGGEDGGGENLIFFGVVAM